MGFPDEDEVSWGDGSLEDETRNSARLSPELLASERTAQETCLSSAQIEGDDRHSASQSEPDLCVQSPLSEQNHHEQWMLPFGEPVPGGEFGVFSTGSDVESHRPTMRLSHQVWYHTAPAVAPWWAP